MQWGWQLRAVMLYTSCHLVGFYYTLHGLCQFRPLDGKMYATKRNKKLGFIPSYESGKVSLFIVNLCSLDMKKKEHKLTEKILSSHERPKLSFPYFKTYYLTTTQKKAFCTLFTNFKNNNSNNCNAHLQKLDNFSGLFEIVIPSMVITAEKGAIRQGCSKALSKNKCPGPFLLFVKIKL